MDALLRWRWNTDGAKLTRSLLIYHNTISSWVAETCWALLQQGGIERGSQGGYLVGSIDMFSSCKLYMLLQMLPRMLLLMLPLMLLFIYVVFNGSPAVCATDAASIEHASPLASSQVALAITQMHLLCPIFTNQIFREGLISIHV